MTKRARDSAGTSAPKEARGSTPCCRIEALVALDARGQILLPKDVREKAGLRPGDKLALVCCESEGKISRITLVKAEQFAETAREMLGPIAQMLLPR
jgi:AbrB family looped-hinge helix DNA binding protein